MPKHESVIAESSLHTNLGFVASAAAVELDRKRRGVSHDMKVLNALTSILRDLGTSFAEEDVAPTPRALVDPTAELLFKALRMPEGHEQPKSLEDLRGATSEMAGKLENVEAVVDAESLAELRDLCLRLSRGARTERLVQLERSRPDHPHYR